MRAGDRVLVAFFVLFAFTSLAMEPYVVLPVDLARATDPLGRLWYFYAKSWDPLFLDPPLFLRVMCAIDMFLFGPFYLVLIYAFVKRKNWIRVPGLLFVAAIVYSTIVYFAVELIGEAGRANLFWVVVVNIPYTLVPLWLGWRLAKPEPFSTAT
jgi:hypothetical protein